jgi:hypothetical protein
MTTTTATAKPYRYRYHEGFRIDELHARYHFPLWVQERCMTRAGFDDWGGLKTLRNDFHQWCEQAGVPPITDEWFDRMLTAHGYRVERGMVSGLFLAADMWALEKRR